MKQIMKLTSGGSVPSAHKCVQSCLILEKEKKEGKGKEETKEEKGEV